MWGVQNDPHGGVYNLCSLIRLFSERTRYIRTMKSDLKPLVEFRRALIAQGKALIRSGQEKIEAARALTTVIRSEDPSFSPDDDELDVIREARSAKTLLQPVGWTKHIMDYLKTHESASLDEIIEEADRLGRFSGKEPADVRLRLRVTLHALMKREEVELGKDGRWRIPD